MKKFKVVWNGKVVYGQATERDAEIYAKALRYAILTLTPLQNDEDYSKIVYWKEDFLQEDEIRYQEIIEDYSKKELDSIDRELNTSYRELQTRLKRP